MILLYFPRGLHTAPPWPTSSLNAQAGNPNADLIVWNCISYVPGVNEDLGIGSTARHWPYQPRITSMSP
jgi:hypothetical protein